MNPLPALIGAVQELTFTGRLSEDTLDMLSDLGDKIVDGADAVSEDVASRIETAIRVATEMVEVKLAQADALSEELHSKVEMAEHLIRQLQDVLSQATSSSTTTGSTATTAKRGGE